MSGVEEFVKYFNDAEGRIKKCEEFVDALDMVPVNQLRYAGRHICDYLMATDSNAKEEQLKKAINHCKRSIYDSNAVIVRYIESFQKEFRNKYQSVVLKDFVDDYDFLKENLQNAIDVINKNSYPNGYGKPSCMDGEEVIDGFENLEVYYEKIIEFKGKLARSQDDINAFLIRERKKERISTIMVCLAIITICFSVIFGIVSCQNSVVQKKVNVIQTSP